MPSGAERFSVEFCGSGSDFFGIWIVNLLLTVVTLGIYVPFARRRTARYFYGQTLLAGSPLEFTGEKRKMFIGFALIAVLLVLYELASRTGQLFVVGLLVFAAALCAPWLWAGAMRFRLSTTRWRGIRLQFRASWLEVYQASWPVFAIALAWLVAAGVVMSQLGDWRPFSAGGWSFPPLPGWASLLPLAALAVTALCLVRLEFNYKRLLFTRALVGDQPGHWKPVFGDFVAIWATTLGLFIAGLLLGIVFAGLAWWTMSPSLEGLGFAAIVVIPLLVIVTLAAIWMVALLPARAYREARVFRLVWNNVGVSQLARFRCDLSAPAYVLLRVRNTLLNLLTLGFYQPFAMTRQYQMKAESVTVLVKGGLDQLVGRLVPQSGALGDAMADVAGLDLIG